MTKNIFNRLPNRIGVYKFFGGGGKLLYIGKAVDIKKRVKQHFDRPHDDRIQDMLSRIVKVEYDLTDTVVEALILESLLIRKLQPKYNIRAKDDKTFLGIYITKEKFPRVFPARPTAKNLPKGTFYGPYTQAGQVRQALKILRRIFPWCNDKSSNTAQTGRPCFYFHLKLCPGPCAAKISPKEYQANINRLKLFLRGRKKDIIKEIKKEMWRASQKKQFENAAMARNQLYALEHIRDVALILKDEKISIINSQLSIRVEGYDISNISGKFAVGAMIVYQNGKPNKSEYRMFKIRTVSSIDDVAMMVEVVKRRLKHSEWPRPSIIIIDGGVGHYNAVKTLVGDIPLVAAAKGPDRKKADIYPKNFQFSISNFQFPDIVRNVRDEAHRFAIKYHRRLRSKSLLEH